MEVEEVIVGDLVEAVVALVVAEVVEEEAMVEVVVEEDLETGTVVSVAMITLLGETLVTSANYQNQVKSILKIGQNCRCTTVQNK